MKKIIGLVMCICLGASVFTGCTDTSEAPKSDSDSSAKVIATKDDLNGARVGVQLGTTGDIYVTDECPDSSVERFSKGADAIVALTSGKLDCVVIDAEPAKVFIEKNEGLKVLDEPFTEEEYAIAISKDKTELKDKINEALATLKADGTLDKIISNYIGDDTTVGKNKYESPEGTDRSNGKLIMATNAAFEPYEYLENEKIVGIDADMAQAVCDILGMELEIEDIEFDSIITEVQSGKADIGVAGMTVTEDRLKNIDFTDAYTTSKQVIIVKE